MANSAASVQHFAPPPVGSRLALGTAQFGMRYGATNAHPVPTEDELARILDLATTAGVGWLDTAPAYGMAETLLGRLIGPSKAFRIVTKIPPLDKITDSPGAAVRASIVRSLDRLRRDRLDVVLLHRASDLDGPAGPEIASALTAARTEGLVGRIGASLYDPEDLDLVLTRLAVDVVQVPLNPFDRRFASEKVRTRLRADNVAVHARSLFLQGLLVADMADLPEFARGHPAIVAWCRWLADNRLSALSVCLSTILADVDVELGIVGAPTFAQLDEILQAAGESPLGAVPLQLSQLGGDLIDPRRWPLAPA